MSWRNNRPDGWEETLGEILDRFNVTYMNSDECELIEAGADAILRALRKGGIVVKATDYIHNNITGISMAARKNGRMVFIPDEE